ncbi:RraA family protein [Glaciecola sp. XM2]|uniref:RraA family protein n=1 Tax=Glaciecola sp. XM2 TaxID=1914931 RepID=UPI001BDE80E3|nr:RraA family protein [Glaciecola sp. XM2]MBT1451169.1 RraA family protein [Glaciecola sp. XM2]
MPMYADVSPCDYADAVGRESFVDYVIKPLYPNIKRIAGPAFTVYCPPGDHLMLHAAIYRANPGDIIVAQADDSYALAGGNVCAIAQKRGIAGFVIDGTIRDLAEVREMQFPVFARGVIPKPGKKAHVTELGQSILCGGATVNQGDIVVADEEGIVILGKDKAQACFEIAKARAQKDAAMSIEQWQEQHRKTVESKLAALGFIDK